MKANDSLLADFEREAQTTRRFLERLPDDKLDWRPHAKSSTAGELGSHVTDLLRFAGFIFTQDEFNFDPSTYKPYQATSVADLLKTFDENLASGKQVLAGVADEDLKRLWQFKIMGRLRFERPKGDVFRDFALAHQIHHRGQLSVYLRLLDVPVPGAYGPSADE